jgi:hypothetical protein
MTRQHSAPPSTDDHGWLITPRALTSLATVVGLVYSLHTPVRYVMQMGATVDALKTRVATLETEIDHQRSTIAAAELMLIHRNQRARPARKPEQAFPSQGTNPTDPDDHTDRR